MKLPSLILLAGLVPMAAQADVKLPGIFGNHMVIQQEATLPVWGWADVGEKVDVSFSGVHADTITGSDGKWRVDLPALPNGASAGTLQVAGKNTIAFSDVLVGDVWICSGQSNMEFGLIAATNGKEAVAGATDSKIRFFRVPHRDGIAPCDDVVGTWIVCSPQTTPGYSAVAYFLAKNLRATVGHPIGLIETVWSGACAQAWVDKASLEKSPMFRHYLEDYQKAADAYPGGQADLDAKARENQTEVDRTNAAYRETLKAWDAAVAQAKTAGQEPPPKPAEPPRVPPPAAAQRTPTMLFNGMIAPLVPLAFKGVAWYQGEDNTGVPMAFEYRDLLPILIASWRAAFGHGDFPFLLVQLPNSDKPSDNPGEPAAWAVLRESQLKTAQSVPNTGMAVAIDLGDGNLHPPDKADVGARLALVARHLVYGENLQDSGPIYDTMKIEGNAVRIAFKPGSIGGGLIIGTTPRLPGSTPADHLEGFALAGIDKKWVWADAKIEGNEVVVSSPQVSAPVAVRYGWQKNPTCTLYNKDGLPASPFRTDDWPPFQ